MLGMLPFSHCLKIESYHSYMRILLTTSPILSVVGYFVVIIFSPDDLDMSEFFEYASIFLKIGSDNILISAGCDDM